MDTNLTTERLLERESSANQTPSPDSRSELRELAQLLEKCFGGISI